MHSTIEVPSIEDLMSATKTLPLPWRPHLQTCDGQTSDSYAEQTITLERVIRKTLLNKAGTLQNHLCLVGPPGFGKKLLTQLLTLYAISQGLNVLATSLPAE